MFLSNYDNLFHCFYVNHQQKYRICLCFHYLVNTVLLHIFISLGKMCINDGLGEKAFRVKCWGIEREKHTTLRWFGSAEKVKVGKEYKEMSL